MVVQVRQWPTHLDRLRFLVQLNDEIVEAALQTLRAGSDEIRTNASFRIGLKNTRMIDVGLFAVRQDRGPVADGQLLELTTRKQTCKSYERCDSLTMMKILPALRFQLSPGRYPAVRRKALETRGPSFI